MLASLAEVGEAGVAHLDQPLLAIAQGLEFRGLEQPRLHLLQGGRIMGGAGELVAAAFQLADKLLALLQDLAELRGEILAQAVGGTAEFVVAPQTQCTPFRSL